MLTWNVWVNHPELVDQEEWQEHAEKWRKSIDVNHISPERWVSPARFHDGTPLPVPKDLLAHEVAKIHEFLTRHTSLRRVLSRMWKPVALIAATAVVVRRVVAR